MEAVVNSTIKRLFKYSVISLSAYATYKSISTGFAYYNENHRHFSENVINLPENLKSGDLLFLNFNWSRGYTQGFIKNWMKRKFFRKTSNPGIYHQGTYEGISVLIQDENLETRVVTQLFGEFFDLPISDFLAMPWVASSAVRRLQTAAKKPGTSSSNEFRKEVEDIRGINTKVSIFRDDVDVVLNYYCSVDLLNMAYMKKAYRVLIEDFNCETPQALAENEASFSEVFEIS